MELLGTIVIPAGQSRNNLSTTSAFDIADKYEYVLLVTPSSGAFNTKVTSGGVAITSDANEFDIGFSTSTQIALPSGSADANIVAIYSAAGGSVRVYGLYGRAQS